MTKCPKCGENRFSVIEKTYHNAELVDGKLDIGKVFENETECACCDNCGYELDLEKVEYEYTW